MIRRLALFIVLLAGLSGASAPASAHPHVWVQLSAEVVYAPDGSATGIRHVWLFDDMYSTFATEPIKPKVPGQFTREELAPLAQENMDSLKDYDFFTYVKADGQALKFGKPQDYWLTYNDQMLTLHYTLPFEKPVHAAQLVVEIYDPEFFIDFTLVEKNPFALASAPPQCKFTVHKTDDPAAQGAQILPDAQAKQPDTMNFGAQFANRVTVECPVAASLVGAAAAQPREGQLNAGPLVGGFVGWILAKQAEFYRQLSAIIRQAKADGNAVWALLGLSFLYGIFHAAGPGHGKAVISSYLVANEETWFRGVVLSFASALLQAIVAVALVGLAVMLFKATTRSMCNAERIIEIASYGLIVLLGLRLLWVKGRAFAHTLFEVGRPLRPVGAAVTPPHHHDHRGHAHGHEHGHHHHHDHGHHHDHDDASAWGHAHGPEPDELAGPGGWQRGLSAIVAVGLRPCSGAILVLVFALAQGLFAAGEGGGTLIMRGIEFGAAGLVLLLGSGLLFGYIASDRVTCF